MAENLTAEGVYKRLEEITDLKLKQVKEQLKEQHEAELKAIREELTRANSQNKSLVDLLLAQKAGAPLQQDGSRISRLGRHDQRGIKAAKYLRCLMAAKGHPTLAADIAKAKWGSDDSVTKALGGSTLSAGGAMVPVDFVAEVIDALRDVSSVLQFDPISLPMPNGSISMPFVGTGISANYTGENVNVNATQMTLGQLALQARKLMAFVASSNDLLKDGGSEVDRMIRDDMIGAFVEKMDSTFLRSTGSQNQPKGLLYWAGAANATGNRFNAANVAATDDGSTLAEITNDLGKCIQKVLDGKLKLLDPMRAGWTWSNRIWRKLFTLRDGNGNLVFQPELITGTLFGFKWTRTSQIPNNLTGSGGTADSEVYFASYGEGVIIGETQDMEFSAHDGAAYVDSNGTVVSALSQDQTVFKGSTRHDLGCRFRGAEVAVIERVRWGA